MKKTALLICLTMLISLLASCIQKNDDESKKTIICTYYPHYNWTENIVEGSQSIEVSLLVSNGNDIHSYQPTAADILKIKECEMFVYVGGDSDSWVEQILESFDTTNIEVIRLLDLLGERVKTEEIVEGMDGEHDEDEHEGHSDDYEAEVDEHVWLSLKNASFLVSELSKKVIAHDSENASKYTDNAARYDAKLKDLDRQYEQMVTEAEAKTIVVCDRFPFRYLADDYDIDYFAAFSGCSAETEASFKTVIFLADKIDEYKLSRIAVIETSDKSLAKTVISETQDGTQEILVLDSIQTVSESDIASGKTYLSAMEGNLEVLRQLLN